MIIVMKQSATREHVEGVIKFLNAHDLDAHLSQGKQVTIIGVVGDKSVLAGENPEMLPGVEKTVAITETYKLANKNFSAEKTAINVSGEQIGGKTLTIMAGPCAVENREQLLQTARAVKAAGAQFLRGGAYKPRTSPYSFQGLEVVGLKYMKEAAEETGLKIVTEVTTEQAVEEAVKYVDVLQIGTRNMQNFGLLREAGKTGLPVLLKRGLASTIDEWLNAAEYIMSEGNKNVILCERGIRTYETSTRNTLDISAVPVIKNKSHLPILVDPSHACGVREFVAPLSMAAVAAGADGLIIEVHITPEKAVSDGPQSLNPEDFKALCDDLRRLAPIVGKEFKS